MKKFFYCAAFLCMLTACEKETTSSGTSDIPVAGSGIEIKLKSNLLAFDDVNQDVSRASVEDKVPLAVYVDNAADDTELYGKVSYMNDDSLDVIVASGLKKAYYPENGDVDIYAVYPSVTALGNDGNSLLNTVITHKVAEPGFIPSNADIMMAIKSDVAKTEEPVELQFKHLLSNLAIAIESGAGAPDIQEAELTLINMNLEANIDFSKRPVVDSSAELSKMISAKPNTVGEITVKTAIKSETNSVDDYGKAIVVPQTIAKNVPFLKIQLKNQVKYASFDTDYTFESGKRYVITVTINQEIKLIVEEEEWEVVDPVVHELYA